MKATGKQIPEIAAVLDSKNITHIAIIDDAYNKYPRFANVGHEIQEQLVAEIHASPDVERLLHSADLTINSTDDLSEESWISLWTIASKEALLSDLLGRLAIDRNEALATLRHLETVLRDEVHRTVSVFGSEDELPDTLAKIIFIDYYLDGTKQGSLDLAKRIGSRIKQLYISETEKPLIVLMSSRVDISDDDRVAFREAAGVIGGMFHFVWKNEFREADRIRVWLYLVTATIDQGRVIQQCVSQLEAAVRESVEMLTRQLRGLSVDDFGYMQQLTLEKEGEPISEYVVSCLASFFIQQFRSRVLTDRLAVDELLFDQLAFGRESPSAEFVKLFMGIVSQPVGALARHPRADSTAFADEELLPTNVHFGDLFVRGPAVVMVATPECDLVTTPHQPKHRKFDPEQSVLLIPGVIEAYSKPWSTMGSRTEFIEIDSVPHAVRWDFKKVYTNRLGSLKKHLDAAGLERRLRLNPEFALDVQRMYFTDIGRIGLPVGPPIYEPLDVTLCCQDVDGTVTTLFNTTQTEPHYAVSFVTKTEKVFQLTGSFFLKFPTAISAAISKLEERAKVDEKARGRCGMRVAELKKATLDERLLAALRKPFKALNPDSEQDCPSLNTVLKLSTKKVPAGAYSNDRPLLLVIGEKQKATAAVKPLKVPAERVASKKSKETPAKTLPKAAAKAKAAAPKRKTARKASRTGQQRKK